MKLYNGLTYTIMDECLEMSELVRRNRAGIETLQKCGGEDFSFGYVYSIVDVDISNAVAVNITNIGKLTLKIMMSNLDSIMGGGDF